MSEKHSHYYKDVTHLRKVDVYRVLELFGVYNPTLQHAVKKLLVAGGRGAGKDQEQDVREAIDSLNRFLQMRAEDCNAAGGVDTTRVSVKAEDVSLLRTIVNSRLGKRLRDKDVAGVLLNFKGNFAGALRHLEAVHGD